VKRPLVVLTFWIAIVALSGIFSSQLSRVLRGGTDPIAGSPSEHVTLEVEREFGEGSLYQYLIVLSAPDIGIGDARFSAAAARLVEAIGMAPLVRTVETPWNSPRPELFGRGGHTALIVVTPRVNAYLEAEKFNRGLRRAIAAAHVPKPFLVQVTGTTAAIHAMDVASSSDLLAAERVGLPLTLVILLFVFGAPLAALLPVVLALIAVSIGFAGLYALHGWTPVTVFAENVVSMIGLGVGVDYALFVVSRYREEARRGLSAEQAAIAAAQTAGHSVLFSGATVAVGFLALFLVRAPFLHTIALGGVFVVAAAVAASLTLLPAVLVMLGPRLMWPRKPQTVSAGAAKRNRFWPAWAGAVMQRPWLALITAGIVLAVFIVPVARLRSWNIGAAHLPPEDEARQGYETLSQDFPRGWMSPIVALIEAKEGHTVWEPKARIAIATLAAKLAKDARSGTVLGAHQVLGLLDRPGLKEMAEGSPQHPLDAMPAPVRAAAARVVSADGRVAILALMTPGPPEDRATMAYVRRLRALSWPELESAGLQVQWGGFAAVLTDFDHELFGRLPWVALAVIVLTFGVLAWLFKSIVLPLKATLLNTVSVLAAYGFLVLVFQEGRGAEWIGLDPPGGLNAFVVVMLFTILFGLSMDYEVFLLSRVREEYLASGDNARAVAAGLGGTAGIITSAALIMISIFASFGFTRLAPTREFGLGLAFAVALDASIIRVMLVPALMAISGKWNWWWPGSGPKPGGP
jgi:RND superfamily putative drug exporter